MKVTCKSCGIVNKPHICPHKKENRRRYDKDREDKKIYKTKRWQELREQVLQDYNYICLWSFYIDGEIVEANEVHHIVEILEDESKAYDDDNLIPLEYWQHKYIHDLYKKNKAKAQELLHKMQESYVKGDRTLGKYKKYIPPGF